MKRIITSLLMLLLVSYASFAGERRLVAEGKSFTPMGNFRIETSDEPVIVNGVTLETYQITYENSDLSITIAIESNKQCRRFITISDELSVQYVCYDTYFGLEKLTEKNAVNNVTTSDENMDRVAYFHQKVLTPGKNDIITCMKLIGAYFPELLKSPEA